MTEDDGRYRRPPPGREAAASRSPERRIWYGYGQLARGKKDPLGMFLHDVIRVFGEVAVLGLPALLYIWQYPRTEFVDVTAMALVAWVTMTIVGALVRGGWIHPLWTAIPGWVTLAPSLLVLRVGYFNLTLLAAAFGGLSLSGATSRPWLGLLVSGIVATVATLLFPRTVDEFMARRR
ncbi:hypothetical protein AArcSl_0976 [Halalkaliarchaeum desulfuricum]|uniref:DUF8215 domain-containing protein n=1 Tax=Halalkaliarchaeum desulfuricum TaxID=2055893 RepID=A0A343THP2_9EURY|nr:hypothetical protein [Halalkaliarchaeum desulfuricum]AUX08614.1 hypothetical protein AArcSl_0976 [Halalkaliarchaeum desulfuricum]